MSKDLQDCLNEKIAQELWYKYNVYSCDNNPGKIFSIDTPPPTVSGNLHIGHIFSYTQTDIIARYKRMCGFSVFYPFGFDDNGLPTEKFVEKKNDIIAHNLKRSDFIQLCLKETEVVEHKFKELWQKIGLSVDWSLCYSTIDDRSRKISQESFIDLYNKGFIYRKDEPALYCTSCRTSVAQAELDDAQKPSIFNDIKFLTTTGCELIISTTRPELLPSCVAIMCNSEDARYKNLEGQSVIVPIFGQKVQVIFDDAVVIEKGSGLVMCCTFGDKTDIEWFKKYNLPYKQSIGFDGKWVESTGPLAGLRVTAAREKILELLKNSGLIIAQKPLMHNVNVHERCKKEIEYAVLPQWFIKILPYKEKFIELADSIDWFPSFMKSRYKNWVENLSWDWCISRQRFFGIPFPVWHCLDCKTIVFAKKETLPVDPQETKYPDSCPKCKSCNIEPDKDVMDTWNTSSLTPYICFSLYQKNNDVFDADKIKSFIPMSMRPQAHDIIRTWAFDTIVKSWMHHNIIPWQDIVISGHVLSSEKSKISKSQGNTPLEPEALLQKYAADAIRYWTASGNLGYDIAFSENQLKIGQKLVVKLLNAFKFASSYATGFKLDEKLEPNLLVNRWIISKASISFIQYKKHFEQNEFSLALDAVEKFFWADFCDNYLELIKDIFSENSSYSESEILETKNTLYFTGFRILQLYAPFVPHITENIYQVLYKEYAKSISLHQTRYEQHQTEVIYKDVDDSMEIILDIVNAVRRLKTEHQLSLRAEIDTLCLSVFDEKFCSVLNENAKLLKGITKAHNIGFKEELQSSLTLEKVDDKFIAHIPVALQK